MADSSNLKEENVRGGRLKGFIGVSNKERFKRVERGLISVECTIVRKTHVGNDGGGVGSKIHNGVEENAEEGGDTFFERTFREIFPNLFPPSFPRFSLTLGPLFLVVSSPRITDAITTASVARSAAFRIVLEKSPFLSRNDIHSKILRIPLLSS